MPTDITSSTQGSLPTEEARLKNYRNRIQYENEIELRNIEFQHSQDRAHLSTEFGNEMSSIRGAYEVKISEEAEQLDQKLRQFQTSKEQKLTDEKHQAEIELMKLRTAHQDQVKEFKKTAQGEFETLHKKFQASAAALHNQAKKSGIKEPRTETGE